MFGIMSRIFSPKVMMTFEPFSISAGTAALIGSGALAGLGGFLSASGKKQPEVEHFKGTLPPTKISKIKEVGPLLLESLRRSPQGIPEGLLNNINALLQRRGQDLKQEAGANIASLGGSTGTSQSPLLADMLSRQERGINLDVGGQINQNLLQDILTRNQDRQFIDQQRLQGANIGSNLIQARSAAERGAFATQQGVRASQPPLTDPLVGAFTTGGNVLSALGGLDFNTTATPSQGTATRTPGITALLNRKRSAFSSGLGDRI